MMRVRFSSVREFLSLHSSPPWGPLSYLSSAHSDRTCIPRGVWRTWRVVYTQRHAARLSGNSPYAHTQTHTHTQMHYTGTVLSNNTERGVTCTLSQRKGAAKDVVVASRKSRVKYSVPSDGIQASLSFALQQRVPCCTGRSSRTLT